MEPSKSQVEFYVDLFEQMLYCDPCGIASKNSIKRDIMTIRHRTAHEGLSFLTKTLPKLGKALDAGLASMHFSLPCEFHKSHDNASIPAFMQAYFKCIFDADGTLLDTASPSVVKHLRQVLLFAYKLILPFQEDQIASSLETFISTDGELNLTLDKDSSEILEVASYIVESIFQDFDPKDIVPRHGPGAVATGERLEDKWTFARLYNSIHQTFPYYDYFIAGGAQELVDRLDWYKNLTRLETGQAKVVCVPKDSRGPRLISCEPLEYQWIQQGLGRKIVRSLEFPPGKSILSKGQINFTDQSINQKLALSSSLDGSFATIDLKDASDRVSLALVRKLFKRVPRLLRALEACRTSSTKLPDGRIVEFQKFAPMGSALCFPVEALCFWVLLVAATSRHFKLKQRDVGKTVFVYGDDIIIPRDLAQFSIQTLERFDLKVNLSKCCIHGPFRESCGTDAFKGVKVTPVRLRTPWSGRMTDGSAYVSYIETANALQSEYKRCSDLIWSRLEKTYGKIPYGTWRAGYPCRIITCPDEAEVLNQKLFRHKYSRRYQRIEFMLPITSSRKKKSTLDGWTRMLRNFTIPPYDDPSSIVVPRSMIIKRGWTAVG